MMNMVDKKGLEQLRCALRVLNSDNRRLPLSVYRVMVALGEADEPCSAYAVARRAGFLLEQGRVKLHEAKQFGVVESQRVDGLGVLWVLTDKGLGELERVRAALCAPEDSAEASETAAADVTPKKRARKRKVKGE